MTENKSKTVLTKKGARQVSLTNTGLPNKKISYLRSKPASKIINDMTYMKYKDKIASNQHSSYKDQQERFKLLMDRSQSNWLGQIDSLQQKVETIN